MTPGTWRLGDHTVRRLGFGTMRLTGTQPFHDGEPRDRATAIAVLRRAVELGVDHIDTAAFYFSRLLSAPELVNAALWPYDGLTVATKVGPVRDPMGEWAERPTPERLRGEVEHNLRLLGTDHLPLVYFRVGREPDVAPYVAALAELVREGSVGHVGVSGVSLEQLDAARAVTEIAAVQNRADDLAVLRRCGELQIAFVPFFTLVRPDHDATVDQVAQELGATSAQVRIAATLALGDHVLAIPGTGTLAHLEENVAAGSLSLNDAQRVRLAGSTP